MAATAPHASWPTSGHWTFPAVGLEGDEDGFLVVLDLVPDLLQPDLIGTSGAPGGRVTDLNPAGHGSLKDGEPFRAAG
ncbi:hypothetical protein OV450_3695 [Actinobacteria bacterium OV450]|nr:hypothetical protein OV450_3695 [Actinobacteria bacterium OV450]